jgi:hypothetical protein
VRSLSLPGGLSAGEVAMLGPVGDPPAVANPDQLQPRRVGDKAGPLKDNDVGYLNGQVWTYPVPKKEEGGPVKILFSVVEGAERIYYVGGDRKKPKELFRHPVASYRQINPAITNTGKGPNSFVAAAVASKNVPLSLSDKNYWDRVIINLKSGNSYVLEPEPWIPAPINGLQWNSIELTWRGRGFFSSGTRFNMDTSWGSFARMIPAEANYNISNEPRFLSAWGPGGGGYDNSVSAELPGLTTRDVGFNLSVQSRNYAIDSEGLQLKIKYGTATEVSKTYQELFGGNAVANDYGESSISEVSEIDLGLGLSGGVAIDNYSSSTGINGPVVRTSSAVSDSSTLVGNAGVIFLKQSGVRNGASETTKNEFYYRDLSGSTTLLSSSFFQLPNENGTPTSDLSNVVLASNLVGATLHLVAWPNLNQVFLPNGFPPLPSETKILTVQSISVPSGSFVSRDIKFFPLPSNSTTKIHSISYHP